MTEHERFESSDGKAPALRAEPYTLVVGLGASGLAAAEYLRRRGETVVVIDSRAEPPGLRELRTACPDVDVALATLDPSWLDRAVRVVLSPGLAIDLPIVVEAERRRIPVVGELELFAEAASRPVVAVTGSNGKSTVTSLTAHLLTAQGFDAPAGGNLGPAALRLLERPEPPDAYVIEVSSFQLETTHSLTPHAAALLNVSPDHIDRHRSLERYASLKASLIDAAEYAVVNADDPIVRAHAARHRHAISFSVSDPGADWSVVERGGERWLACSGEPLIPSAALGLTGVIGEANSLASLALAQSLGGDIAHALEALPKFAGLPHRCRSVGERRGVVFVDDSKGTNVGATVAAISGAPAPVVLIAGGQGKGADFTPLVAAAEGRVRAVVLIGEA
ncbi:MAG: UDP-N-acetylmuramoyl-L-alanine--D-glutamate ligase, partial [Gammaproteobacteria bacterium]|nr:UDP-N-acetylmuramoyl-L-alanine--D-glutamate ligase [Gammaproteobacteria bacterium]